MERTVTDWRPSQGGWVVELACGHTYQARTTTGLGPAGPNGHPAGGWPGVGGTVGCDRCDLAEPPAHLRLVRTSEEWGEETLPPGLRRRHRLGGGTWGLLRVHGGRLAFSMACTPPIERELGAGECQAIPPGVPHHISVIGPLRCAIDFLEVDRTANAPDAGGAPEEGGDPACWIGLVCPDCGILGDGAAHRPGCRGLGQP